MCLPEHGKYIHIHINDPKPSNLTAYLVLLDIHIEFSASSSKRYTKLGTNYVKTSKISPVPSKRTLDNAKERCVICHVCRGCG